MLFLLSLAYSGINHIKIRNQSLPDIEIIFGLLSDKYDTKATMVFGNICIAISYALLGPADCFKMGNATLTTIIISMVILGIGLAAAIVPSMADMVVEAK